MRGECDEYKEFYKMLLTTNNDIGYTAKTPFSMPGKRNIVKHLPHNSVCKDPCNDKAIKLQCLHHTIVIILGMKLTTQSQRVDSDPSQVHITR
jgi:hypothetical protein